MVLLLLERSLLKASNDINGDVGMSTGKSGVK